MTKIIVVETHNTDRPEGSSIRGAIEVPEGDRLIQRNGSKNVAEFIIKASTSTPTPGDGASSWNRRNRGSPRISARFSVPTRLGRLLVRHRTLSLTVFAFWQFYAHARR